MWRFERQNLSPRTAAVCLGLILAVAAVLYVHLAALHPLSDDEALYGSGGQAILDGDFLLHHTRVMKPFVIYYLQALAQLLGGRNDLAARLPGILAALFCLGLVYRIGDRWFDGRVGLWAAALLAFSPFVLKHFPNARTDAPALCLVLAAVALTGRGRTVGAGFVYALAFATRQLTAFSLPLVVAFAWLNAHTSPAPPAAAWPWWKRETWRFAKGAALPMAVLLAWSSYTQEPFGWLVRELSGDKYQPGGQARLLLSDKFLYWIDHSLSLFGARWLTGLILVVVFGTTFVLAVALVRRWWRVNEKPAAAALLVLGGFVFFFYLAHSLDFFTLYERFLIPVAPWIVLFFAAGATMALDRLGARWPRRQWMPWVGAVLASLPAIAFPAIAFVRQQQEPKPVDDIPIVVSWIAQNGGRQPVLISGTHGSEAGYYARGTGIKVQHFGRRPDKVRPLVIAHGDRELFVYLNESDLRRHLAVIREALAPSFRLEKIDGLPLRRGELFGIRGAAAVGFTDGRATFFDEARIVSEPLTCALIGRLLAASFVGLRQNHAAAPEVVELRECEIENGLARLSFTAEAFQFGKLTIDRATFAYRDLEPHWNRWLAARRFTVRRAAAAEAAWRIAPGDLADYIALKNRNLSTIEVQGSGDRLTITARAELPLWRPELRLEGTPSLDGRNIHLRLIRIAVGGRDLPAWLVRRVERQINPVFDADLSSFGLRVSSVEAAGGLLLLQAVGLPAAP